MNLSIGTIQVKCSLVLGRGRDEPCKGICLSVCLPTGCRIISPQSAARPSKAACGQKLWVHFILFIKKDPVADEDEALCSSA